LTLRLAALLLAACDADTTSPADSTTQSDPSHAHGDGGAHDGAVHVGEHTPTGDYADPSKPFSPPPPKEGYMRIVAPTAKGLAPGSNSTHCQYIHAAFDRDLDVLDVTGYQSSGGHHAVAYAIKNAEPVGTNRPCLDQDNLVDGFIGGVGGEASGGVELPPNVAFRLPKGSAIQLNAHYINTTDQDIDGDAVIDFKFAEVTGDRTIASLFNNGRTDFMLPANTPSDVTAECVMPKELHFILFANHMHDHGASAKTELVHADGRVELVHEDLTWRPEMAYKAVYSKWSVETPLVMKPGDMLRTRCSWNNSGASALTFPGEMCFGTGFYLSDGSSSPVCLGGRWIER
jgi:hypothetical protein